MAGSYERKATEFALHAPKAWQVRTGQGMCALMWLWIMYRAKNDGPALLGLRHPWDGHGHGHGHDGGADHALSGHH